MGTTESKESASASASTSTRQLPGSRNGEPALPVAPPASSILWACRSLLHLVGGSDLFNHIPLVLINFKLIQSLQLLPAGANRTSRLLHDDILLIGESEIES